MDPGPAPSSHPHDSRPRLVAVAGASGRLGTEMLRECRARGFRTRAVVRNPRKAGPLRALADEVVVADALLPETLPAAVRGADWLFSCLGASVIPIPRYGRATFTRVDLPGNRNLIDAAKRAGVERCVYVSVFGHDRLPRMDFVRGHEGVVEHLRSSGLRYSVVRPTGFYSAMDEILLAASRGLLPEVNGGRARTNPIHEADLAEFCLDAFDWPHGTERDVGGPDPLPRREIARLAWEAMGGTARAVRVPVWVLRSAGVVLQPFCPRVGHLFRFIAEILCEDFVAPCYGSRHIAEYFRTRAAELQSRGRYQPPPKEAEPVR